MKNFLRTDLASELTDAVNAHFDGVCRISEVRLGKEDAQRMGKSEGRYITLETSALTGDDEGARRRVSVALT